LIAPMIAVSMAPAAPPAIACEMMPPMLGLPDCAAAMIAGYNNVTIWPVPHIPTIIEAVDAKGLGPLSDERRARVLRG
jgi:hypothetical protein